jgi:DNA-binding XRE family transcriptional regulator
MSELWRDQDAAELRRVADVIGGFDGLLRGARISARLTLREVADATGLAFNTVKRIEDGNPPNATSLVPLLNWMVTVAQADHVHRIQEMYRR